MIGFGISIVLRSGGDGQTTRASGSNAVRAVIRTVMPSGNIRHGSPARTIAALSDSCAAYFVSACAARSGDIMTGRPSRSSQRPSRPSAQKRNASTSMSLFAVSDIAAHYHSDRHPRNGPSFLAPAAWWCLTLNFREGRGFEPRETDALDGGNAQERSLPDGLASGSNRPNAVTQSRLLES